MIKKIILATSLFFLASSMTPALAKVESTNADTAQAITELKQKLKTRFKSEPSSIKESLLPNVFEVMYGTEVIYVSSDGKYFLAGDMINLDTRENLSEVAKQSVRKDIIDRQDNKPVTFKAKNEKHVLKVFTDIDCPYCAKLHREVPELNAKGITVEYLMFPRAGIGSGSFKKAVSMWCADDQLQAMTDAKERKPIAEKTCDNPIEAQYTLGQEVGVTGTPALVTESGRLIPGYMPADRLAAALDADK
ncbi:bifunctional protein-disulfide isomerase/oxidoreductase DsbC [Cocleimonas flava]|uniref:Thiol:disulfide interchange protein n=1 Tax=Cocleimonas flava TaxID=634765 RepID=A0A4R1F859_9GAMM|nr:MULTISPECIES: DsbC family protein [Cocleimonas]MEB8432246.1 DsbC family protein [Cocleimonas sp. KMM 6892]MEC4714668.1 DsbC family protein [Cocleimonas sp. KMM 6895]MEC4744518.1 DsbC family protein [Cocleimonas sp. KMM 6896]TCJ86891.1 thiol:disulfide interchange protein DsbC [Cocleimonas flava]